MLEALVAEDGQVRLAVELCLLAAERFDDQRRVREVNDARSLGISRLEQHPCQYRRRTPDEVALAAASRREPHGDPC